MAGYYTLLAFVDSSRIAFVMGELGQMISITKNEKLSLLKFFPTLNVLDPVSLKGWLKMRSIVLDYGKTWIYRHSIFFGIMIIEILLIVCYIMTLIFRVIDYRDYRRISLIGLSSLDVALILMSLIFVLSQMSNINGRASIHTMQIWLNKAIITELYTFRDKYFLDHDQCHNVGVQEEVSFWSDIDDDYDPITFDQMGNDPDQAAFTVTNTQNRVPQQKELDNPLYQTLTRMSTKIWGSQEEIEVGLRQMISLYEYLFEVVKYEDGFQARTLLGMKVTVKTFVSLSVFTISIVLVALEGLT